MVVVDSCDPQIALAAQNHQGHTYPNTYLAD
jgi:hypothetical protein